MSLSMQSDDPVANLPLQVTNKNPDLNNPELTAQTAEAPINFYPAPLVETEIVREPDNPAETLYLADANQLCALDPVPDLSSSAHLPEDETEIDKKPIKKYMYYVYGGNYPETIV